MTKEELNVQKHFSLSNPVSIVDSRSCVYKRGMPFNKGQLIILHDEGVCFIHHKSSDESLIIPFTDIRKVSKCNSRAIVSDALKIKNYKGGHYYFKKIDQRDTFIQKILDQRNNNLEEAHKSKLLQSEFLRRSFQQVSSPKKKAEV